MGLIPIDPIDIEDLFEDCEGKPLFNNLKTAKLNEDFELRDEGGCTASVAIKREKRPREASYSQYTRRINDGSKEVKCFGCVAPYTDQVVYKPNAVSAKQAAKTEQKVQQITTAKKEVKQAQQEVSKAQQEVAKAKASKDQTALAAAMKKLEAMTKKFESASKDLEKAKKPGFSDFTKLMIGAGILFVLLMFVYFATKPAPMYYPPPRRRRRPSRRPPSRDYYEEY
jgi:hypothetical protein